MTSTALPGNSACPRCDAGFHCGMGERSTSPPADKAPGAAERTMDCWCLQLPHGLPIPSTPGTHLEAKAPLPASDKLATDSCFCPACLEQITHERPPHLSAAPD